MSDYAPEPVAEPGDEAPDAAEDVRADAASPEVADPVRTGVADVDAVLDSVDELEGRPVDEHAATFESAHERLRSALDASSGDSAAG